MAFCLGCASHYEDGKKFCKLCGSRLTGEKPPCEGAAVAPPVQGQGSGKPNAGRTGGTGIRFGNAVCGRAAGIPDQSREKSGILPEMSERTAAEKVHDHLLKSRNLESTSLEFFIKLAVLIIFIILLVTGAYRGYGGYASSAQAVKTVSPTAMNEAKSGGATKAPETGASTSHSDEQILQTFEKFRQANLAKDITLFMSCYSSKFPAAGEKRRVTVRNWKRYDYVKLDYTVDDLEAGLNRASGKVQWRITAISRETRKPLALAPSFNVVLEKEDGSWKVVSLEKI